MPRNTNRLLLRDFFVVLWITIVSILQLVEAVPSIRVHQGLVSVHTNLFGNGLPANTQYIVGQHYTFEIYMEGGERSDYMIDSCTMNGVPFIGAYGCVQCGNYVQGSVETEQYNTVGAIKRTLVHFTAPATSIQFVCQVKVLDCCACAERSCERRPALLGIVANPMPVTCGFISIGGGYAAPSVNGGGYAVARDVYPIAVGRDWSAGFPWWVWLILALLLLLLLLCCIFCCLSLWAKKRKQKTTVTTRVATVEENKAVGVGVGTENPAVLEKGVGTNGSLYKEEQVLATSKDTKTRIIPAIIYDDGYHTHSRDGELREESIDAQYTRIGAGADASHDRHRRDDRGDYETYGREDRNGGSYSVREGRVINEQFIRNGRPVAASPDNVDRSSYRNYAFERDMGRVAPMSGFDEVETTERRYCLSDDESEFIEKDVKRTHTIRFESETRTINEANESNDSSERFREEGEQHVVYAQNLRV